MRLSKTFSKVERTPEGGVLLLSLVGFIKNTLLSSLCFHNNLKMEENLYPIHPVSNFLNDPHIVTYLSLNSVKTFESSRKTVRANGNVYHIFKPKSFRAVQNLYQDKASIDMTPNE